MTALSAQILRLVCALALLPIALLMPAENQKTRLAPIYDPTSHKANVIARPRTMAGTPSAATTNGSSCTLITFEGLADTAPIPDFYGIGLPDWLSIIEQSAGGTGNFANEPSPVTIAFWLNGNPTSQTINIPNGASQISLYYSSAYNITLTAYDAKGNELSSISGPANFDTATGVYDMWSQLSITAPSGTPMTSLSVTGYANYTGVDNLNVCQSAHIASVEITQAIQQYQALSDLKTSLQTNHEPPVPIIAGKPAVLRVYFDAVQSVNNVTVHLTGVTDQTRNLALQPNCTPQNQRAHAGGCQSMDFYFTPPSGSWTATLDVIDTTGNVLEEEALPVTSRSTDSLRLRGVSVCDALDAAGNWLCANAADLLARTGLITRIAPTSQVTADVTSHIVQRDIVASVNACASRDSNCWWNDTVHDISGLYGLFDTVGDFLVGRRTTYFGMIRPAPTDGTRDPLEGTGGIAAGIPSHGAMGRTSALRFHSNTETNVEVVGHETGHTLGLRHTNTINPSNIAAPPGCYNLAADGATDWTYPSGAAGSNANTNNIQSTAVAGAPTYEVGFDVTGRAPIDPASNYELMSYCSPRWISPQRYKTMIATLNGGAVTSPSARPAIQAKPLPQASSSPQPFWKVSGTIQNSTATFDPLFEWTTVGDVSTGAGTYSLQEQDSSGTVLFQRQFTPESAVTETSGPELNGSPAFSQMIPVTANAAAIVLIGPANTELGRITLGGTAPTVTITAPGAGFNATGTQTVSWTVQGAAKYTSMVLYSADNGSSWSQIGKVTNASSLPVNFDNLPGTTQAVIQVLVSDGVNTGSATSPTFTVPRKAPGAARIDSPVNNFAQPAADPIILSGSVYDVDDGVLSGSALQWSSNLQGNLGTGSPLTVTLEPGQHTITLTGTDSDRNTLTATTTVIMGGQPPIVAIQGTALNSAPTTCEFATISASPGANAGAPLSLVQYSVDGGVSYTTIPLGSLPYGFLVPGSGFLHLVARAYDISGQSNAQDVTFFIQSECTLQTQTITFNPLGNVTFGTPPITLSASASSGLSVSYSATGPATVAGSTLTITGVGTVTVTAMQAGNSSYAPASWVSHSFVVSQGTPSINWPTPSPILNGTTLSGVLNATAAVGQTQVPGAFAYTAQPSGGAAVPVTATTVLATGTYTLTANFTPTDAIDYLGATASVMLTVEDFSITSNSQGQTVKAGASATYTLAVAPVGGSTIPASISFSASGLPPGGTASFSPSTVASGSSSTSVTMTVQTAATSGLMHRLPLFNAGSGSVALCVLLIPLWRRGRKLNQQWIRMVVLAVLMLVGILTAGSVVSCGGGGGTTPQPQSYTLTVTASAGGVSHTTTVSLTVQ
jgi:hypothetical protein